MTKTPKKVTLKENFKQNFLLLKEIYILIKKNKKWWLMPIFFIFTILTMFMILAGGGAILPAIYAIF